MFYYQDTLQYYQDTLPHGKQWLRRGEAWLGTALAMAPPLGRVYATADARAYVFVPKDRRQILVFSRTDGGVRAAPTAELDSLVGPSNSRCEHPSWHLEAAFRAARY
eukprot:6173683-Pleurochrysis_carterae.AAC.4